MKVKQLEKEIAHHRSIANAKRKELSALKRKVAGDVAVELGLKKRRKKKRRRQESEDEVDELCNAIDASSMSSDDDEL